VAGAGAQDGAVGQGPATQVSNHALLGSNGSLTAAASVQHNGSAAAVECTSTALLVTNQPTQQ
jgi:hypothetical protein